MTNLRKGIHNAQQRGIDVQQVVQSYATHLTRERRKVRDNPRSLATLPSRYSLSVIQECTATGVRWKSLGGLPDGMETLAITANSHEAARNKMSLRALLEQRYRNEFASALQRMGLYQTDLAGRRAARQVAIDSPISVADLAEVGCV